MKELVAIDISLENCELYKFPIEEINFFSTRGLSKNTSYVQKVLHEFEICNHLVIEIAASGNIKEYDETKYDDNKTPFERLQQYRDIVSFGLHYLDGSVEDIYVIYDEEPHRENTNQTEVIDNEGNLVIMVDEKMVAAEYVE